MHWGYVAETLKKFGLSGFIFEAIMSLCTTPSARVFTSGSISKQFSLSNGTRQGCPLSPIIFSLAIEPLAISLRSNPNIVGIKVGQIEHKLGLFADDVLLTLSATDTLLEEVTAILDKFGSVSYYKINHSKCFVLPMNIPPDLVVKLKQQSSYNWDNPSITYLGIQLTYPPNKLYEANYPSLLTQITQDTQSIKNTQLSWIGRIAAFKMKTLPKILYYFRSLPIPLPTKFFTQINSKLSNLVWLGKKPRIALSTMSLVKAKGGLNLLDLRLYYFASLLD